MHTARLNYLASQHAPSVAVVSFDRRTDCTIFTLQCGHISSGAPHFHPTFEPRRCYECGKDYVRNAPQYAAEFNAPTEA